MKDSLNVVDGAGQTVPIPDNVRLYLLSSLQHGGNNPPRSFPGDRRMCENPTNPVYHGPTLRALLMALDAWADKGVKPPDSNYPTLQAGTLVTVDEARRAFPKIPGVTFPDEVNGVELLDFGPAFTPEGGRLTHLPPKTGARYNVYVPKPNEDGLDVAGVRPLEVRVPIGTHTGWNVRKKESRGPNLCALDGSFIPFAVTKDQRTGRRRPEEVAAGTVRQPRRLRERGPETGKGARRREVPSRRGRGAVDQTSRRQWNSVDRQSVSSVAVTPDATLSYAGRNPSRRPVEGIPDRGRLFHSRGGE